MMPDAPAQPLFSGLCRRLARRVAGQRLSNALFLAATQGDLARARRLLWLGAHPDAPTREGHARALNLLAMAPDKQYASAMARELLSAGANPNGRDRLGSTPLHFAAQFGMASLCETLLDGGADPEALDADRQTPTQAMEAFALRMNIAASLGRSPRREIAGMIAAAAETRVLSDALPEDPSGPPARSARRI